MATIQRYDSTSSSEGSSSPETYKKQYLSYFEFKERHLDADCKYLKQKLKGLKDGRKIYVLTRDCRCGKFKSYAIEGLVNLIPQDGKEIHMSKNCKWRSSKSDPKTLKRKCVCSAPTTASRIGDTNSPMKLSTGHWGF